MTRYEPSRNYLVAGLVALILSGASAWCAAHFGFTPTFVPAALFLVSAVVLLSLALRPVIEIHPRHLRIGRRAIPWVDVKAVDVTGWTSPLVARLTLADDSRVSVVYPGDVDMGMKLLRHLRRMASEALLDGIPYNEFWSEEESRSGDDSTRKEAASPRYRILREEDEAEVERLFQRLKTVGNLDQKNGSEEN